ncbi:hydroxyacylglutathione hydrolase [Marinospirillum insulare]|uniref:Hydroxyacylglutathione hydrolase n=1 Tax=Marinospirillum insulare TaxID=217169 RepID=A0ABQ5ZW22_9GAMM|nr:hydroxyacylglutathione hydrolase [Marinospirillum insulare]GLR62866.1 hydroxyacylglutathione hydrolase [Marinospirillum insulare]
MLEVQPIHAFNDNYIWLIKAPNQKSCWVVDPGDATPVLNYLQAENLTLEGILLTHHHYDHIDGVADLAKPGVEVVGFAKDAQRLPALTQPLVAGDTFELLGERVKVMEVPGHTLGHIVYFIENEQQALLFSGDTLFAAGCGRMFEGTPEQMQASLQSLASLPASTQVFAAHEYTLSNLKFALLVEPNNPALQTRMTDCTKLREAQKPTLPSNLGIELATNPFLRLDQPEVLASLEKRHPEVAIDGAAQAFKLLRAWKDTA